MLFYVSLGVNVALLIAVVAMLVLLNRAGRIINGYESFFQETLTDLEKDMRFLHGLMTNSVILAADENVQRVYKAMKHFYRMLLDYHNAGNGHKPREDQQKLLR
jgi:hypothetical protein